MVSCLCLLKKYRFSRSALAILLSVCFLGFVPRKMRKVLCITLVTLGALTSGFGLSSCATNTESLSYAAITAPSAVLVYIAQDQGFFKANGISVEMKEYPTGVATTEALLKSEVEVAWSAELPFITRAFDKEKISIIAVSSRFSDQYLFGRKDRGIENVSDLKGKIIGVPRNTIAEFYLGRFLELNGLNINDVSLVDVKPPQSMEAISNADVDGVVTWEPYASQISEKLADNVVDWSVQSDQLGYGVVMARNDWITGHPETVKLFLESLAQAESFIIHNSETAKTIVQNRANYDDKEMQIFWSENEFPLSLDQSLVVALEDEARWMIKNNLTTEKEVPLFNNYIYEDALKAIKPEAVNIIR
jgi:NitT/TauT family transport system substrate-binding protein